MCPFDPKQIVVPDVLPSQSEGEGSEVIHDVPPASPSGSEVALDFPSTSPSEVVPDVVPLSPHVQSVPFTPGQEDLFNTRFDNGIVANCPGSSGTVPDLIALSRMKCGLSRKP